jgi:hypothetical protein
MRLTRSSGRLSRIGFSVVIAASVASVLAAARHQTSAGASTKTPISVDADVTYYGWYDNTPPGCATAYSGCAKGTGTYAHPITFASSPKEFPVGTIVYYPTVEKYFVMGDLCQECEADWNGKGPDGGPHLYHLDLWIGGKGANEYDLINCEDALTQATPSGAPLLTPLILDPPSDLPVSSEPLFDAHTSHCFGGLQTETTVGRYVNKKTGQCLSEQRNSAISGSPLVLARCDARTAEDLSFDGAFFTVNKLCLHAEGSGYGSRLDFTSCTGGPYEQWEINANGTIAWIQYLRCITDVAGTVVFGRCAATPDNEWTFKAS